MADAYTDRLGLIGQEEGTHSNEWGDLLNLNFERLDAATRGYTSVDVTGGVTLDSNDITTTASTAQENSFFQFIEFTNTAGTVTVPAENIMWIVYNNTDGNLTFQPSGGTGVTLTQGQVHFVIYGSNGTTFTDVTTLMNANNAATVTVADESSDTTCFPLFVTAATGDLAGKTGTNLTFDSSTGELVATEVTASKLNATGDTAADDNAAMGYTATEGLILTGQGSVNDVTIKNDADTDVISIPTGTTGVTFAGDLTVGSVVQPSIPAQVTGHIRAGNTQLVNGDATLISNFDVAGTIADSVIETVGPTGSGADNIWTGMDNLPPEATILLCNLELEVDPNSTNAAALDVRAMHGDDATPAPGDDNYLGLLVLDFDSAITGDSAVIFPVMIPLGATNQDFHLRWAGSGNGGSEKVELHYRGFMTD